MQDTRLLFIALGAMTIVLIAAMAFMRPTVPQVQVLNSPDAANVIAVTGTGVVMVKPDTAHVTLGFNTRSDTAQEAQAQANTTMDAVIQTLRANGVPDEKIKTLSFNIYPEYNYRDGGSHLIGYRVDSSLRATVTQLDAVGTVIDSAIRAGANQVSGIEFTVQDPEKFHDQAVEQALDNAKAKADTAAQRLGVQVAGVKRMSINSPYGGNTPPIMYKEMRLADEGSAAMQVAPGELEIQVQVQVDFLLK